MAVHRNLLYNFLWQYSERLLVQGLNFVVSLILARLLSPAEYGLISIALIFILLLEVFVTSGVGNALVQKKESDATDFSTMFYFNAVLSIFLYCIIFISAPCVAEFYGNEQLTIILRILSIRIVVGAFNTIQSAYVQKEMKFRKFFIASFWGTIVSAVLGVVLAYRGYGVYALIYQYLSNTIIVTIVLSFMISWKPQLLFSWTRLRSLLSYSWKLLMSGFLNVAFSELKSFVIGKKYTMSDLAYYDRGRQFPSLVYENINTSIGKVLFPVISESQDNLEIVKHIVKRSFQVMSFVLFPLLFLIFVNADLLVEILLTSKWLGAVPFLRVACITYMCVLVNTICTNAINSLGRSDLHLKVEYVNIAVGTLILLVVMNYGTIWIALSVTISALLSAIFRVYYVEKLIKYSFVELVKDVYLPISVSLLSVLMVFFINTLGLNMNKLIQFFLNCIIFGCSYLVISYIVNKGTISYLRTFFGCK